MTPTEIRAAARLAARTLAGTAGHVEQVHHAVAARAFLLTKPVGTPVQLIHDAVANGVYAWVRAAELAAGTVAGEGLALAAGRRSAAPAGSTHASNLALAFLNAAIGHRLAEEGSPLAIRMAVRMGGRDVRPDRAALAAAFPAATTRLAVFLHGLGETDEAWRLGTGRDDPRLCRGTRLADDFGYTPVYLRYNTGLHISENGRQLAGLLAAVVANWPATVEEIVLIGHSMSGLVARSGCHDGQQAGAAWVPAVRHCATATSSTMTGATATPTPAWSTIGATSRCWRRPTTTSSRPRSRATPGTRSAASSATSSCSHPAPTVATREAVTSRSGSRVGATSAACITSTCSTIPPSTRRCASGWTRRRAPTVGAAPRPRLLLRRCPRDKHADRRPGDHRPQRLRVKGQMIHAGQRLAN